MNFALLAAVVSLSAADTTKPADPPILFDAYYVSVRCAGVDARVSRYAVPERPEGRDIIGEASANETRRTAAAAARRKLTVACSSAAEHRISFDEFEASLTMIDAAIPQRGGDDGSPLNNFVDLQASSLDPGFNWSSSPDSVKRMTADYYIRMSYVNQRAADTIVSGFRYYTTLLIVDSGTPLNPETPKLYEAFRNFGGTIGARRAAIWLGAYDDPSKPDVDHARFLALHLRAIGRYKYDFSGGPYLVFTDEPPDVAKSAFPIDLAGISTANRVAWIDQLADRLNQALPPTTKINRDQALFDELRIRVLQWIPALPSGAREAAP